MIYGSYDAKFCLKICVEQRIEEALVLSLGFQRWKEKLSEFEFTVFGRMFFGYYYFMYFERLEKKSLVLTLFNCNLSQ